MSERRNLHLMLSEAGNDALTTVMARKNTSITITVDLALRLLAEVSEPGTTVILRKDGNDREMLVL